MIIQEKEFDYLLFTKKRAYIKLQNKPIQKIENDITIDDTKLNIGKLHKQYINQTEKFKSIIEKNKYGLEFPFKISKNPSNIFFTKEFIYSLNMNYKDCSELERFKFTYGHELGHFFEIISENNYLSNYNLVLNKFLIYLRFINSVLGFFLLYLILSFLINALIYYTFDIKAGPYFFIFNFLFFSYRNINDVFMEVTNLIYNIKNIEKIIKNHSKEIFCDLFSKKNFDTKIKHYFKYKNLIIDQFTMPNTMSHPNIIFRHLSFLFSRPIFISSTSYLTNRENEEFIKIKENLMNKKYLRLFNLTKSKDSIFNIKIKL